MPRTCARPLLTGQITSGFHVEMRREGPLSPSMCAGTVLEAFMFPTKSAPNSCGGRGLLWRAGTAAQHAGRRVAAGIHHKNHSINFHYGAQPPAARPARVRAIAGINTPS